MLFRKKKSEMERILNVLRKERKEELHLEKLFRAKAKEMGDSDYLILAFAHQHARLLLENIETIILNGET